MKGMRVLTDEEVKLILNELGIRDRLLFLTCLTFGTRISEALSLTFGDVAGRTLYIKSKKGSENRGFPIPGFYAKVVNSFKSNLEKQGIKICDTLPLFLSNKVDSKGSRRPISRQRFSYIIKQVANKYNLQRVGSHSARKTFVSTLYNDLTMKDLALVRIYSRHKSLVNLQYYIGTTESTDLVEKFKWC